MTSYDMSELEPTFKRLSIYMKQNLQIKLIIYIMFIVYIFGILKLFIL